MLRVHLISSVEFLGLSISVLFYSFKKKYTKYKKKNNKIIIQK